MGRDDATVQDVRISDVWLSLRWAVALYSEKQYYARKIERSMEILAKRVALTVTDPPRTSGEAHERELMISPDVDGRDNFSSVAPKTTWRAWYEAFKQIFPTYFAVHLAVLLAECLSFLFLYSQPYHLVGHPYQQIPTPTFSTFWLVWNIWPHDTPHYIEIALHGYNSFWLTAYFPLYPLLIRIATPLTGNQPLLAALLVSNLAGLSMLVVFYQLVKEEFDETRARRAVLYLSIFPSAFFFVAGYTETTFLCFVLLSFYQMRHGRWWWAGLFGFLAALTRNAGILLFIPFCYEYLRQRGFRLEKVRFDGVSIVLIPAGLSAFMLYCYQRFRDPLAFQHAEAHWHHIMLAPWTGLLWMLSLMIHAPGLLSFTFQRNAIEFGSTVFIGVLLILSLVGPWRFPRAYLASILFAAAVWLLPLFSPIGPPSGVFPYQSLTRYMLVVFPAFIVLASLGKYRMVHYTYLMVAGTLFFFLLTQFLLGYLVV